MSQKILDKNSLTKNGKKKNKGPTKSSENKMTVLSPYYQ